MPIVTPVDLVQPSERQRLPPARVVVEGSEATTMSPEGLVAKMPLDLLLKQVTGRQPNTVDLILPEGVRAVIPKEPFTVFVWESPPRLHNLTWLAKDSPMPYGPAAKYRQVRLALPYLIVLAVFETEPSGQLQLSRRSECYFRNAPLRSLDDELFFPALLNCYWFGPESSRPLSWICVGGLHSTPKMQSANMNERIISSLEVLRQYLLETGFNHSDGLGGKRSWFEASRSVDPRLNTVEAWEEASAKDPLFVLDIPWRKSGHTVRQAIERMREDRPRGVFLRPCAATLARHIFNHQAGVRPAPSSPST